MYRRIELINSVKVNRLRNPYAESEIHGDKRYWKQGLCGLCNHFDIALAWVDGLRGPDRPVPLNARFYFTERGWADLGRKVIEECQRHHQEYRVIAIKETDAQVVWRDKYTGYEVAVQPKRKR